MMDKTLVRVLDCPWGGLMTNQLCVWILIRFSFNLFFKIWNVCFFGLGINIILVLWWNFQISKSILQNKISISCFPTQKFTFFCRWWLSFLRTPSYTNSLVDESTQSYPCLRQNLIIFQFFNFFSKCFLEVTRPNQTEICFLTLFF